VLAFSLAALLLFPAPQQAQAAPAAPAFEVATIRPVDPQPNEGRYFRMESANRFIAKSYTVKLLIAAAYDLNPKAITGGQQWIDSDRFDISAVTPGDVRPTRDQQMAMLRTLLTERFQLTFHRQQKQFAIYLLTVTKEGAKLKSSGASENDPSSVISTVYPGRIVMPARNASMQDFTSVLQRAVLDRPVVNKTGLTGRYDFDLDWSPSGREFGGDIPAAGEDAPSPPLFTAVQQQLGLKLEATHGLAQAFVIDDVERPSAN
jgi:uncharacterized protein (TIGR03435 family)